MLKPYELLENVLSEIELGIREGVNVNNLADTFSLSSDYLRKLFRFAFKQPISKYIRSRRLSASLDELLKRDLSVLDIALEYGFEYEQSFIESFKREFGTTPGDFRRNGEIVRVTPPINLFDRNKVADGVFFGPEIVMVPKFYIIGNLHNILWEDSDKTKFGIFPDLFSAQEAGIQFWGKDRFSISKAVNPDVYIGITRNINCEQNIAEYLPSLQVRNLKNIPKGFCGETFETSLCVAFRYIGQRHSLEINSDMAIPMYVAMDKFFNDKQEGYDHIHNTYNPYKINYRINHFERIDTRLYNGTYCQIEWFAPVQMKNRKITENIHY